MKQPIWIPSEIYSKASVMHDFQQYVEKRYQRRFLDYATFHAWSIDQLEAFWQAIFEYFQIEFSGHYQKVLEWDPTATDYIAARWFEGISLSYAEHIFRHRKDQDIAIHYCDESGKEHHINWIELRNKVSIVQQYLVDQDIKQGDRVVGILNNTIDTVVIFLAVNSLGAIWSCCSPDFGDKSIIDRFVQIEPKILFIELDYQYHGKSFSKRETLATIQKDITSLKTVVPVHTAEWNQLFKKYQAQTLNYTRVPFSHPIWILYSSGTTGKPKAITHSTGGNLIEHYKALALHQNVQAGEKFLWYTTTGWMMWNYALSSLLCGASLCLYNGAISYQDHQVFWNFVKQANVHHLGGGAAYFSSIHEFPIQDYKPKIIGSTGSPLPIATFKNLQRKFPDAHIISLSGGTDVCSAFLSGCPYLSVYAGEIQCRTLGADIIAVNDKGEEVYNEVGELIIRKPMPSMPVYFWGDSDHSKYKESYFTQRKGLWSHGDWILIRSSGRVVMYGRSDATLNRGGVRIGTAEIYNVLQEIPAIQDSLVITTESENGESKMILFLQLKESQALASTIIAVKKQLREQYSPRHVPDLFYSVTGIPYTLSGKKLEIPVKKIFSGIPLEKAVSKDIMRNPEVLQDYVEIFRKLESS